LPFTTTPEAEVRETAAFFAADLAFPAPRLGERFAFGLDLRATFLRAFALRARLADAFVLRARFFAPRPCRLVAMVTLPVFVQQ
jgi:hypothetical protein